jgi:aspartate/methionine/tyrosine aminotransferase
MGNIGYFQGVSNITQHVMNEVLSDEQWLEDYVSMNQKRIQESFIALKEALAVIDVTVYESKGTLMAWADFRSCLPPNPTW